MCREGHSFRASVPSTAACNADPPICGGYVALSSSWSANRLPWPFPAPHYRDADGRTVALLAPVPACTADQSRTSFRPTSRSPIKTKCEVEKRDRGSSKPFSRFAYVASVAWKGLAFQGQRLDTPHKRLGKGYG
jgi:hypothetical protein